VGILATNRRQWGSVKERRYAALIAAAMRKVAAEPASSATLHREELLPGRDDGDQEANQGFAHKVEPCVLCSYESRLR
jgi:hypothetical protein